MCTSIVLKDNKDNVLFGRTMDFSYKIKPNVYVSQRYNEFRNICSGKIIKNMYSFIGMGQKFENNKNEIIYVDGVNEFGLGVAVLYFPGYAVYDMFKYCDTKLQIDSINVVNFLLGNCKNVKEVCCKLKEISIIGIPDMVTNKVAPLHWIATDKTGNCITIEKMADGLHVIDNKIGVLTNSPNFEWHLTNLRNYINLIPNQVSKVYWDNNLELSPFGNGAGGIGLPGDFSPPSRFVRVAFLKSYIEKGNSTEECKNAFFHIMSSVTVPKGIVITNEGNLDYTQYTSCMDLNRGIYYFNTYDNNEIISYKL